MSAQLPRGFFLWSETLQHAWNAQQPIRLARAGGGDYFVMRGAQNLGTVERGFGGEWAIRLPKSIRLSGTKGTFGAGFLSRREAVEELLMHWRVHHQEDVRLKARSQVSP